MTRRHPTARRLVALAAATAGFGLTGLTATPASAAPAPAIDPTHCPAVRVGSAELVKTTTGPGILVRGVMPYADMALHLIPEDVVYVQQPAYWRYFVVGCGGTGTIAKHRYTKVFPAPTGPVGRYGIEIGTDVIEY